MHGRIEEPVVTVGGGSGSYTLLSDLKKVVARLSAVVAMTDSGGSSRRMMDEFGRPLPLGDLRQALVALSRAARLGGATSSALGGIPHPLRGESAHARPAGGL